MDQKIVRVAAQFGDLPECGAEVFGFLARIGEDQRPLALHAVVHKGIARVVDGGSGGGGRRILRLGCLFLAGVLHVEMLQPQPPAQRALRKGWNVGCPPGTGRQPGCGFFGVADGCGQPHATWMPPEHAPDAGKLAENLVATVRAGQRMDFVDDDKAQVTEQARDVVAPVDEHRLQRFRRNLQDAARAFQQLFLM